MFRIIRAFQDFFLSNLRILYHIVERKMIIFSSSRIPRHGVLPWRIIIVQYLIWIIQLIYILLIGFGHLSAILTDGGSRHFWRSSFIYILSWLIINGLSSYICQWILLLGPSLWSSFIVVLCLLLLLVMLRHYRLLVARCTPFSRATIKKLRVFPLHLLRLLLITNIDSLRVIIIVWGLTVRLLDNRIKELELHIATATGIARFEIHIRWAVGRNRCLLYSVIVICLLVQKGL